jgi:Kinesin motor domain
MYVHNQHLLLYEYSMFGHGSDEDRGLIPRVMEDLLIQLDRRSQDREIAVVISFLEIYCDQIRYNHRYYT